MTVPAEEPRARLARPLPIRLEPERAEEAAEKAEVEAPAPPPPEPEAPLVLGKAARIQIGGKTVYEVLVDANNHTTEERARAGHKALTEAIEEESARSVRVEQTDRVAVIYAGQIPILQLVPDDARAAGDSSLQVHADDVAVRIRKAISAEQKRSAIATRVFSVSLAVLLSLIAFYLLRRTAVLTNSARRWIETHPERIPALKVQTLEFLGPAAVRSGLIIGVELGKWFAHIGIVYLWLLVTLSQFELTQGYVQELTSTLIQPFTAMLHRMAASLPLLAIAGLAVGAVAALSRFIALFFASVARKETTLPWVRADVARPAGTLIQLGIFLSALLFIAPLVTGDPDGVLPRSGVIFLGTLGLAATPLLASLIVGVFVIFARHIHSGDFVVFGGRRGRVREVGLLSVRLETQEGLEIRVPQLLSLVHPTEIFGAHYRTTIEVPVARLHPEVKDVLERAALAVGTQPSVEILHVDAHASLYRVSASTGRKDARTALYLAVSRELEAAQIPWGHEGNRPA